MYSNLVNISRAEQIKQTLINVRRRNINLITNDLNNRSPNVHFMHKTKLYLSMLLESSETWIYILLPLVAFLYASVGHGGASGYLALLAIFGFSTNLMKPTALTLNLFVAAIQLLSFLDTKGISMEPVLALCTSLCSSGLSGCLLEPDPLIYKRVLGILLIFAILRMLNIFNQSKNTPNTPNIWKGYSFWWSDWVFLWSNRYWRWHHT